MSDTDPLHPSLLPCRDVFRRGSYAEAVVLARGVLAAARADHDAMLVAQALSWLGAALALDGQYQAALDVLNHALDQVERCGPDASPARALNYLAVIHEELGDFATAVTLYRRGIGAARSHGERDLEVILLSNLADGHVTHGDHAAALPLLDEAASAAIAIDDASHLGWLHAARGKIFEQRGDLQAAGHEFERAVEATARGFSQRLHAGALKELGAWLARCGRSAEGIEHLHRGLALATGLGVRREIYMAHEALSVAYAAAGEFERALHHHREFFRVHSDVFNDVLRGKVAALRAEVELERSQHAREIERLRSEELQRALDTVEAQARRLEELSARDDLTGLHNRRHANERIDAAIAQYSRDHRVFALAIVDADHFKQVNDRFGHAMGDAVLHRLASVLRHAVRGDDLVARYGGEEFLLMFPGLDARDAHRRCEAIARALATHAWPHAGGPITISIGIADANEAGGSDDLLALADRRLYAAKASGRNCIVSR